MSIPATLSPEDGMVLLCQSAAPLWVSGRRRPRESRVCVGLLAAAASVTTAEGWRVTPSSWGQKNPTRKIKQRISRLLLSLSPCNSQELLSAAAYTPIHNWKPEEQIKRCAGARRIQAQAKWRWGTPLSCLTEMCRMLEAHVWGERDLGVVRCGPGRARQYLPFQVAHLSA
ncbi:hypothetical protein NDU88_005430 [Pleurodeles waltl]|uniref:Uncharacterized protein n=1 Tax=Pleurodeles waltl TaxID=8319 RepID=A0AAV7TUR0_PLEWA|nr:hypothetical protein NDU88_005430 [Pleurodeles waltl]